VAIIGLLVTESLSDICDAYISSRQGPASTKRYMDKTFLDDCRMSVCRTVPEVALDRAMPLVKAWLQLIARGDGEREGGSNS
jgi:hypothetical protein